MSTFNAVEHLVESLERELGDRVKLLSDRLSTELEALQRERLWLTEQLREMSARLSRLEEQVRRP